MTVDFTARITEILAAHRPHMVMWWQGCTCMDGQDNPGWSPQRHSEHVAELIAQAAEEHYRPRIETVEQLDALPVGTVLGIPCGEHQVTVHELVDWGEGDPPEWYSDGVPDELGYGDLPAVALWMPGVSE